MMFTKSIVIVFLAILNLVAGENSANFYFCIDWDSSKNPATLPFNVTATFTPAGQYINCISGGRGVLSVQVTLSGATRYCSGPSVYATAHCGGMHQHGVFPVALNSTVGLKTHQTGVAYDKFCTIGSCSNDVSLFGDHANIVICSDFQNADGHCNYSASVPSFSDSDENIAIIWQPMGAIFSLNSGQSAAQYMPHDGEF